MTKAINQRNFTKFPGAKKANLKLNKMVFWLMGFGVILPFLLPESSWLIDSRVMQWLSVLIPSAGKLARVAQAPNVVQAYVVIVLSLSFCIGIFHFLFLTARREFLQTDIAMSAPRGLYFLWFKALGGIVVFAALIALFYIHPGEPSGDPRGSRGQLIVSLMILTKPGLAIFGGFVSGALALIWFFWIFAIYSFFQIPFLALQSKH